MSTAESWDLVVPEDDAALGAEIRRHGVRTGQLLWLIALDEEPTTVGREQWRLALLAAAAAAPALASIDDKIARELRTALSPHLAELQALTRHMTQPLPEMELSEATRTALADLTHVLEAALQVSKGQMGGQLDSAEPEGPRRRLRFTGALKDAEPDLSARTDEYLAGGFGRE